MSQIHWMLGLIPDAVLNWAYWAIIVAGLTGVIAGWLGRWIPFYGNYVKLLKPLGVILLVLGVWLRGGYDVEMSYRNQVADMQKKVDEAQALSAAANRMTAEQVETKVKVVKGKTEYITKYVDREVVKKEEIIKYIEQCPVPKEIIDIHNQAAEMNKAAEGAKK